VRLVPLVAFVAAAIMGGTVFAQATQPATPATVPAAASAQAEEEALYKKIIGLRSLPRPQPGQSRQAYIQTVTRRFEQMLKLTDDYLKRFPNGKHLDEVQLLRLSALYMVAAANNKPLDDFYKEAEKIVAGSASKRVKSEASYILLRRELEDLRAKLIADSSRTDEQKQKVWKEQVVKKLSEYIKAYPESLRNAEFLSALISIALEDEDFARAQQLLQQMTKQFPDRKITAEMQRRVRLAAAAASQRAATKPVEAVLSTIDGKEIDLASLRGKVVLLDFWATWCMPCVEALPKMKALYAKYHGKGLEIIGVSLDDSKDKLVEFVKARKVAWPQCFDGKGGASPLAAKFEVSVVPTLILLDRTGRIAHRVEGLSDKEFQVLEQHVRTLLAKAPASRPAADRQPAKQAQE